MTILLVIFLVSVIGAAGYLYLKRFESQAEKAAAEAQEEISKQPEEKYDSLKIKESPKTETPAQVEKRLKKIMNPDQEKPFARISKPDVAEVSDVPQEEPKPKKKRNYKKRYRKPQNPQNPQN
jgi:hypothetical protein